MSEAGYKVEAEPERNHLRVTLWGFLGNDALGPLEQELGAGFAKLQSAGAPPGSHLTLVDMRAQGVQSQEHIIGIRSAADRYGALSRRVAILMSNSTLQKLQMKRALPADRHAFFQNENEALAWLFKNGGPVVVANRSS